MNEEKKQIIRWAVAAVILLMIAIGLSYCLLEYHVVEFRFYPKDATQLDLRGQNISLSHYRRLSSRMPNCEIIWDISFQGKLYSSDIRELQVTSLTDEDVDNLSSFADLEVLHGRDCQDYAQLLAVSKRYPDLKLDYQVVLGGSEYANDSKQISLSSLEESELSRLDNLEKLEKVTLTGSHVPGTVSQLQKYCEKHGISLELEIGGKSVAEDVTELTLTDATQQDLELLSCLSKLEKVQLKNPKAPAQTVLQLPETLSGVEVSWKCTFDTVIITTEDKEVDLSEAKLTSIEEVEQALSYFPNVEQVFLGDCGLDNEELAAFRERVRSDYKVVWLIHLGDSKGTLRTDITYFFPGRDGPMGGYVFNDNTSYNLRYCEDLVCVDVGHLGVHDISWVSTLKNLEYLILAHTGVLYLDGIENCKKLKFLEIHWTGVRDLAPLKECTALEDINFGKTWPDVSALLEMPWLKNVYMIMGSGKDAARIKEALPDTNVVVSGNATVAGGWRKLPNYYAMRDALNAPYMNG